MPKIVILGAGYGGILTARTLLKKLHKEEAEITLVNKNDYHYLTTELHQPAAGTFSVQKTTIYIKDLLDVNRLNFIQDEVVKVHTAEQKVELKNGELSYDYLIVGLGGEPETFGTPGIEEHTFSKWNIDSVMELNAHIQMKFADYKQDSKDEELSFIVVGGGFTGVEFMSELAYSIPKLCKKFQVPQDKVRLVLVDPSPAILPGFDPKLVELASTYLKNKGVEILSAAVVECTEKGVTLKDGTTIDGDTVVWAAGVRGSSVIEKSGFENGRGRVKVNEYLMAPGFENVFIVGDCSLYINEETNRPYPPTAQISMQMGKRLALNLVSTIRNKGEEKPFTPSIKGTVASIGRKYAVGVVFGKKIKGFNAVTMKKIIDMRYLFTIGGLKLVLKKGRF